LTLVSDLQYFPSIIFFYELNNKLYCKFEQYEHFQKMSFRNRCTLLGANGKIDLSIPVVGGRSQKTLVREVRIDYKEDWQKRHWRTIVSAYNKSPWFDFYADELEQLYAIKPELLIDWNLQCYRWICDKMSIRIPWSLTDSYIKIYDPVEVKDWRNHLLPSTINQLYSESKRYPQVFEDRFGFVPNLSILDYLFCYKNSIEL
jgi:hypothetical protein